ncbi:hypothetical protein RM844_01700 [Streptomyces sp. DSM 44915]|uniref:Integral membrane protein n=1 Tax=Streptomyces chisholmiae TaxID=3075540 RepID=A0ABU2JJQ8_9ACTN|nr:hypothetical protein [Streptomyces sp. DSM 44915]MDT0264996.1 hypothetical protein [Streptomyces sp. DSM 44915]
MGSSTSGIRVFRAAVFAALCVTLSAGAHVLISGRPLPTPAVALVTLGVFVVALTLAGNRERGFGAIAALLIPLQLAADAVFTAGQSACYGPGGQPVPGPTRLFGFDLVCAGGEVGTPLARLLAGEPSPLAQAPGHGAGPWLLLAAHVGVGLVAAGWLRGGERAVARLLRAAGAATFRPLLIAWAVAGAWVREPARPAPAHARPERPTTPPLAHSVRRRGPPRPAFGAC